MRYSPRQRALSQAVVVIAKAARVACPVAVAAEAKVIIADNPDCGMSEAQLVRVLEQLAADANLPVVKPV